MALLYNSMRINEITTRDNLSISRVLFGSILVYSKGFEPITFTDNATWIVPSGIKQIQVDCVAAQGNSGGLGGRVQCMLTVTPGQSLYIVVGKVPANYWTAEYNASDIRTSLDDLNSRIIVAGAGGGLVGGSGTSTGYVTAGTGGTQTTGGIGGRNTVAVKVGHAHDVANGGFGLGSSGNVCGYEGNGGAGGAG